MGAAAGAVIVTGKKKKKRTVIQTFRIVASYKNEVET